MKKLLLCSLIILLSGCSSKLAYNNADWLVYWYLDDYVELNTDQEEVLDKHITQWMQWHRNHELTQYAAQLADLEADIKQDNMTPEVILAHMNRASGHWERVRDELSPELAAMARTLTDKQVVRFFAALEKDNKEAEEDINKFAELSKEEQMKQRIADIQDGLDDRIGKLTDEQKAIVKKYADQFSSTRKEWLAYRRDIQNAARRLFATRATNPDFEADLIDVMKHPERYRSQDYQISRDANRALYANMASEVAKTLTTKQKSKLIEGIQDIISDLKDLQDDD